MKINFFWLVNSKIVVVVVVEKVSKMEKMFFKPTDEKDVKGQYKRVYLNSLVKTKKFYSIIPWSTPIRTCEKIEMELATVTRSRSATQIGVRISGLGNSKMTFENF